MWSSVSISKYHESDLPQRFMDMYLEVSEPFVDKNPTNKIMHTVKVDNPAVTASSTSLK